MSAARSEGLKPSTFLQRRSPLWENHGFLLAGVSSALANRCVQARTRRRVVPSLSPGGAPARLRPLRLAAWYHGWKLLKLAQKHLVAQLRTASPSRTPKHQAKQITSWMLRFRVLYMQALSSISGRQRSTCTSATDGHPYPYYKRHPITADAEHPLSPALYSPVISVLQALTGIQK